MKLLINGVSLFFDVVGAQLEPRGPQMHERPTLVLLHGGPGADHSIYRPQMDALADVAQLIYLDHRGNGRSDAGPRERWNLAQWSDDLLAFCDALGLVKPILYGASFGGILALAHAQRHPGHAGKLILVSSAARGGAFTEQRIAKFAELGGPAAGALARRRLIGGDTSPAVLQDWLRLCVPHYTREPMSADAMARMINRPEVTQWFSRAEGEGNHFDLRAGLGAIDCPVLVMGGVDDPMLPIENQREIAAGLPPHRVQYEEFPGVRHGVVPDEPEQALAMIRRFVTAVL